MLLQVNDGKLPGLAELDSAALARITGQDSNQLLRFRHRPGRRAVLHVMSADADGRKKKEGVVWFFAGDKAKRMARRLSQSVYDQHSEGLYEPFPNDHRLPELQQFLSGQLRDRRELIGGELIGSPCLQRYRPGISCTFRCERQDGTTVYVKILGKENVAEIAKLNQQLHRYLGGGSVSIARCIGTQPRWRAIAYEGASGQALTDVLTSGSRRQVMFMMQRVALALRRLSEGPVLSVRVLGEQELMHRAENACRLLSAVDKSTGDLAAKLVQRMYSSGTECRTQLIHGDMKLDHVFVQNRCVTFIDTESLSAGDAQYDLAKLEVRLIAHFLLGQITNKRLELARHPLTAFRCKQRYRWFFDAARLQTAKFFAQRPNFGNLERCRSLLRWGL